MARHDSEFRVVPELERRLQGALSRAFAQDYGLTMPKDGKYRAIGKMPTFRPSFALSEFFDLMAREGDRGYVTAALVFAAGLEVLTAGRAVRSHALTRLARMVYESDYVPRRPPRESEIAHMGKFVNELIASMPEMHVQWMEDMHEGDPAHGLECQPTAVIRGVLLSPYLDHDRAFRFWELSVASARFPLRVFSDPCAPDDGEIFSSYQTRAFARIFAVAPVTAVERYASHMRDHATTALRREWVEEERTSRIYEVQAPEHVRKRTLRHILGYIVDEARRTLLAGIFLPEEVPAV